MSVAGPCALDVWDGGDGGGARGGRDGARTRTSTTEGDRLRACARAWFGPCDLAQSLIHCTTVGPIFTMDKVSNLRPRIGHDV